MLVVKKKFGLEHLLNNHVVPANPQLLVFKNIHTYLKHVNNVIILFILTSP